MPGSPKSGQFSGPNFGPKFARRAGFLPIFGKMPKMQNVAAGANFEKLVPIVRTCVPPCKKSQPNYIFISCGPQTPDPTRVSGAGPGVRPCQGTRACSAPRARTASGCLSRTQPEPKSRWHPKAPETIDATKAHVRLGSCKRPRSPDMASP